MFAYVRSHQDEQLLVINNFSDQDVSLELPDNLQNKEVNCLIYNYDLLDALGVTLSLKPYQCYDI
ncbi:alpha-glucosidase C-terminal domain-containing protein [Vibrio sp. 03_296]|uniref:alpha-glucosidase C-terminal domain-containing protein n=1 Tax=Vibrio sp. 03_296 TaxID=2024409 RepID=UPI002D8019C6|nr:alpha-glucosidase C-terminal domain-containing protein [Vibrio sp. 03_296]